MKARFVSESISFERGQDPRDVIGIGNIEIRALQKLSDDELIAKAAKGNKGDEGDIITVLRDRHKGTSKKHWQDQTGEGRAVFKSNTRGKRSRNWGSDDKDYTSKVRSMMRDDELEKLQQYRKMGLITDSQLDLRTQFGGSYSRRTHWAVPGKLSVRMLKWLRKEVKRFDISSWAAPTLIKNADKDQLAELFPLILKTRNSDDSGGADRLAEMCIQLIYRNEKELFLKYIAEHKGEFNIDWSNESRDEEVKIPAWFKKWNVENFVKVKFNKIIKSKFFKEKIEDKKGEIKELENEIKDLKKEIMGFQNPDTLSEDDMTKIVKKYSSDFEDED